MAACSQPPALAPSGAAENETVFCLVAERLRGESVERCGGELRAALGRAGNAGGNDSHDARFSRRAAAGKAAGNPRGGAGRAYDAVRSIARSAGQLAASSPALGRVPVGACCLAGSSGGFARPSAGFRRRVRRGGCRAGEMALLPACYAGAQIARTGVSARAAGTSAIVVALPEFRAGRIASVGRRRGLSRY